MRHSLGPGWPRGDALDRITDPTCRPSETRLDPNYDLLTGTIQKENDESLAFPCHAN